MRTILVLVGVLGAGCSSAPPSCQVAITDYYAAGCGFLDGSTNPPTPYSVNAAILSCKDVNAAVPDRCQAYFDDYVSCLDGVTSTAQCLDCTDEQDRLFGCQ